MDKKAKPRFITLDIDNLTNALNEMKAKKWKNITVATVLNTLVIANSENEHQWEMLIGDYSLVKPIKEVTMENKDGE